MEVRVSVIVWDPEADRPDVLSALIGFEYSNTSEV